MSGMTSSTLIIALTLCLSHVFEYTELTLIFPGDEEPSIPHSHGHSGIHTCEGDSVIETEKMLEWRFDRRVNITRLIMDYSLICPLSYTCGTGLDQSFFYDGPIDYKEFKDCPVCTCHWSCQYNRTCCPGCYYGYIGNECINGTVYPEMNPKFLPMIAKCANEYGNNSSLSDACQNVMEPCTVADRKIIYKNKHCAECNKETEACLELPLKVECVFFSLEDQEPFNSLYEMMEFVDNNRCRAVYYTEGTIECKHDTQSRIAECNVTGLWSEYDADIEWACENFATPYGKFKNVFCYICNPSLSNNQTSPLLSQCPNKPARDIPKPLSEACENLPEISRMFPYKNVYCFACYGDDMDSVYDLDAGKLVFESEKLDVVSLHSEIEFSIRIFGFSIEEQLLRIISNYFRNFWPAPDNHLLQHTTNAYPTSYVEEIMKEYQAVCGIPSNCASSNVWSKSLRRYSNIACEDVECSCDDFCASQFTCCPEYLMTKNPYATLTCAFNISNGDQIDNASKYPHTSMKCDELDDHFNSIFIIKTCPMNAHNDTNRYKCESMDYDSDILKYIPVSDGSKVAYRNIYCLFCNTINSNGLTTATVYLRLKCNSFLEVKLMNDIGKLLDLVDLHCKRFVFFPISAPSGFNTNSKSYNGSLTYINVVKDFVRFSDLSFYSKCNETGIWAMHNEIIKNTCEGISESILALKPYKYSTKIYKNFACFICNPVTNQRKVDVISDCADNVEHDEEKAELCNRTERHPIWAPYKNFHCSDCNRPKTPVMLLQYTDYIQLSQYKFIFSISKTEFVQAQSKSGNDPDVRCTYEVSDTESRLCQKYYCFKEFILVNDVCTNPVRSQINDIYLLSLLLRFDKNDIARITADRIVVDLTELGIFFINQVETALSPNTRYTITELEFKTPEGCNEPDPTGLPFKSIDVRMTKYLVLLFSIEISYSPDILYDRLALVQFMRNIRKIQLHQINPGQSVHRLQINVEDDLWNNRQYKSCALISSNYSREPLDNSASIRIYPVDEFLYCPMVKFNIEEVIINTSTRTLYIASMDRSFGRHMYRMVGMYVYLCAKSIENYRTDGVLGPPFLEEALNTTTYVCTILSITCLSLTFLTYSIFYKLREKVIGKSNMILCLTLSIAQALVQFGIERYEYQNSCVVIGLLIHYFLICAFCTMNVCAFNMFKIFYINRHILDTRVKFRKYLVFVLAIPFMLVSSVVIINLHKSNWTEIGYGKNYCFISYYEEMIVLFFLPSITIFVVNAGFFSLAFYAIRSSPNIGNKQDRRDFILYIKLSSIVGLSWPLLIVDNLIGLTWFSFITSGLNALQGVFIFFSYVFNKRVGVMYRELILGDKSTT